MDNPIPKIDALNFNYTKTINACYSGALRPPTDRSLGIAIRPNSSGRKPVMKLYFQPSLMEIFDLYIGNYLNISFTDTATHIKVEIVTPAEGVMVRPAANNDQCIDYGIAKAGTQYRSRIAQTMSDEFLRAFTFDDKCNVFVEPQYIRKGKYLIAPLDDMPIFPAKKKGIPRTP